MRFPAFGHTRQRGYFAHPDHTGLVTLRPAAFGAPLTRDERYGVATARRIAREVLEQEQAFYAHQVVYDATNGCDCDDCLIERAARKYRGTLEENMRQAIATPPKWLEELYNRSES